FENPDISPISGSSTEATSSFITPRHYIPSLSNLAVSPILRREGISSFIIYRSITTRLEPKDLDDPFSLPPYNEDTTVINFPPRRNSLPNTVYPIHPEETDPVLTVIVDINSPNEELIRTLTPEASLVNQPDPVNEAPLSLPPTIQNPLPPNNMAQVQALTNATNAINALAVALGQGTEKSLLKIDFFRGDGLQDPITWIEEFRRAAKANK
ncbi:45394_t:CDS:2, partial [Gigaspora margarita]